VVLQFKNATAGKSLIENQHLNFRNLVCIFAAESLEAPDSVQSCNREVDIRKKVENMQKDMDKGSTSSPMDEEEEEEYSHRLE